MKIPLRAVVKVERLAPDKFRILLECRHTLIQNRFRGYHLSCLRCKDEILAGVKKAPRP